MNKRNELVHIWWARFENGKVAVNQKLKTEEEAREWAEELSKEYGKIEFLG